MIKKNGENKEEVQFKRFKKLLDNKKNVPDFEKMSPYEIINYLREENVKKNYSVLPSNGFLKRMVLTSFIAIFLVCSYVIQGSGDAIQKNIDVFVNKIEDRREYSEVLESSIDYIVKGDFKTLIDSHRANTNPTFDETFELVTMLSSINNISQANEELFKLKNRIEQVTLIKNAVEHKKNVYKLIDNFLLLNNLEEASNLLNKNRQAFESDMLFLEKEITYKLLNNDIDGAVNLYNSINFDSIDSINSLLSYAKVSVNFSRFDRVIEALDKVLIQDVNNIKIIEVIDMIVTYDNLEFNKILNSYIEQNEGNERLKLIRAKANSEDLSKTQFNIEDIDEFIKKHPNNTLSKIIKLEILTNALRMDEATRIANEFKNYDDLTFDICYALSKYSLGMNNFNDAMNYVKQAIELNNDFYGNYEVLLDLLVTQNKSLNINYFYLKMKLLDLINTNTDKMFVEKYTDIFNDPNRAVEILEFANKISAFDADLRYRIARIYIDQRKDNEAKEKLYKAIELNPKSIYFRTLGVLLVEMGEEKNGIENIRKAYSLYPDDILNLNNASAYYANVEKNVPRAFSNIKAAYEGLNDSYKQYEAFIIRENYFKLQSIYDQESGDTLSDEIPVIDYIY